MSDCHFTQRVLQSLYTASASVTLHSECFSHFTQRVLQSLYTASASVTLHSECFSHFTQRVLQCPAMCSQRCFVVTWLVPHTAAAISAHVRCTPKNRAPVYSVTSFEATYAGSIVCLAATCHLHLWQNDQDLLRAYCGNTGLEWIPILFSSMVLVTFIAGVIVCRCGKMQTLLHCTILCKKRVISAAILTVM